MSKLMEQNDILHHRVQVIFHKHETVSHDDFVSAPLSFEGAVHNFNVEFFGYFVGITSPTLYDKLICLADDLRCRGVQ